MDILGKQPGKPEASTTQRGQVAESAALAYLQKQGLKLVERNYRTPGRGGGEIDLILRDRDGSLVFVEVRSRNTLQFGGAAASIVAGKQRRIILAARHYLLKYVVLPPCRFDVVSVQSTAQSDAPNIEWLKAAFDAS